jgi:metal-sulfur cluster biosynthetic enzyme
VVSPDAVLEALREVIDPEIGVNIVDLGLVYGVDADEGGVRVRITMTTPACPMGPLLVGASEAAIRRRVAGAAQVRVELVWDPPWDPSRMTDAARRQLRAG